MNFRKIASLVTFGGVILAAGYGMLLVRGGFSARETPSWIERFLATNARKMAVPASYRQLHNPFPPSPENMLAGMEHFADHCATCHANNGSSDTLFGKGLYPKPPDMRAAETQEESDGALYYTIENGIRLTGMPAFGKGNETNNEETWKLISFIRHLPALSTAELAEMAKSNPKTEDERKEEQEEEEFLNGGNPSETSAGESHHHH